MGLVVNETRDSQFEINNHFYDLVQNAFKNDSRCLTNSISSKVIDADKVNEIFDDIS